MKGFSEQLRVKDIKELSPAELYHKIKLPEKLVKEISHVGDDTIEKVIQEKSFLEEDKESKKDLLEVYRTIIDVLKEYCDINEKYYPLISLWIVGTYFQQDFPTYPYLFFNAMKGSGKSRTVRLITYLSKEGSMLNSLTEAVLFRTTGTLGIDEFEGLTRKGNEALRELLNSAYKKGIKVKRMKKMRTLEGETQVVEEFNVYRPILMCNINGMDDVLGDRCVQIILERSANQKITKKMEIYDIDTRIQKIKVFPFEACRLCRVDVVSDMYIGWNTYIDNNIDTNNTIPNNDTNSINENLKLYQKINETGINGRNLELAFPLFIMASWIDKEVLEEILNVFKDIIDEKRKEDAVESLDVSLIDFVSQELENQWIPIKQVFIKFSEFTQVHEDWFNEKWMGRALKRLGLILDKKRMNYGRLVVLNISKAQEKIKMFK